MANSVVDDVAWSNLQHQLNCREAGANQQCNPDIFKANLFRDRYRVAKNLYKTDLRGHFGCVNAIEFSHGGKYLASGGDDKRVLVWDLEKSLANLGEPRTLDSEHSSNIFCLDFDRHNRRILSGGNDDLVIMHDFETGKLVNVFKHENPVYGLSIDPQCDSVFATACEDGQILVFDHRSNPTDSLVVAQLRSSFHAVQFHPNSGNHLITANSIRGAAFWDVRRPHNPIIQYGHMDDPPSCMSVRFNSNGNMILALRRRLPPILYSTKTPEPICTFYHSNYYNSCTMKSCTFAGEDDEFVLSGSDDFNLYVWRVSDVDLDATDQWIETSQMVLYSHRSIVNQVRYNRDKCLLASSGVEKIVKLWSPFSQKGWTGSLLEPATCSDNPRELYSPFNFSAMSTPPHGWSSHDYSNQNVNEDPRMMAFFDSLIQQEIESWQTNSTESSLAADDYSSNSSNSNSSNSGDSRTSDDEDTDEYDDDDDVDDAESRHARVGNRRRDDENEHRGRLQRQNFANRIAYLIATKRSTLRRLAIKGASLRNRRPHMVGKMKHSSANGSGGNIKKKRHTKQVDKRNHNASSRKRKSRSAPSSSKSRSRYTKHSKSRDTDSTEDDESDSNESVSSADDVDAGSSRSNNSNLPIPSTSTGITSNGKDSLIRMRRQQQYATDSDEDDVDDELAVTSGLLTNSIVSPSDSDSDSESEASTSHTTSPTESSDDASEERSPPRHRCKIVPKISAALKIPRRFLPPQTHSHAYSSLSRYGASVAGYHYNRYRDDFLDSLALSGEDVRIPSPSLGGRNGYGNRSSYRRSSYRNDAPTQTTPRKRRRLTHGHDTNDSDSSNTTNMNSGAEETLRRNNLNATAESASAAIPVRRKCAQQQCQSNANGNHNVAASGSNTSSSTLLLQTPDSGISVTMGTPEDASDGNSESEGPTASTSSRVRVSPRPENSGNRNKTGGSRFRQKASRVRRNYRRKFADESDSD